MKNPLGRNVEKDRKIAAQAEAIKEKDMQIETLLLIISKQQNEINKLKDRK